MIRSPLLPSIGGRIAGRWIPAQASRSLKVINPATGEHLADVPDMSAEQTASAVEAAAAFLREDHPLEHRRQWLANLDAQLMRHKQELARIITLEQGKSIKESLGEVDYAAGFFRVAGENLHHLQPRKIPQTIRNCAWTVYQRPAGVAALITPWNFPLALLAKKLGPAIGAGCGVVMKPADLTPLSAIALCTVAEQAGVPAGMLNLVIGQPGPIGTVFCTHPLVRLISFTGSTRVGKLLLNDSADHVKRVLLELGGNAPFIVFEDADLDATADALVVNKFRTAGQTCVCANRFLVQKTILPRFIERVVARCAKLRVGNGMDEGVDFGPLINRSGFEKVSRHVQDAIRRGARRLLGDDPPAPKQDWGFFYPPTVLSDVKPGSLLCEEETFGPVVAISSFDDDSDAFEAANNTVYGLAAYVFTRDPGRIERASARLHFGHVAINSGTGPTPEAPFGGVKQSGFGREGGVEGLLEFCEPQTVARA